MNRFMLIAVAVGCLPLLSYAKTSESIEWVTIGGGKYLMGADDGDEEDRPVHEVTVKTFSMTKTEVTVKQYAECVIEGQCSEPDNHDDRCNWEKADRKNHPINCVDWSQANQYAKFVGARLPTEVEWEFAAKSRGKNQKYPWGKDEPTCDRTIMYNRVNGGCGTGLTMWVCSQTAGNTEQGLCDMLGNVWEWVQDKYASSYTDAPNDGSAYEKAGLGRGRVIRGGSFAIDGVGGLRADAHAGRVLSARDYDVGFRLAK